MIELISNRGPEPPDWDQKYTRFYTTRAPASGKGYAKHSFPEWHFCIYKWFLKILWANHHGDNQNTRKLKFPCNVLVQREAQEWRMQTMLPYLNHITQVA
jgi:hypothetical protein